MSTYRERHGHLGGGGMGKVEAYREPLQRDEARHEAGAQLVHALGVLGAARAHERLELLHHRL